jgi:hypothetical protein
MVERVATKLSFFETDMEYAAPYLDLFLDRRQIITLIYATLKPWSITIDDIDILATSKPNMGRRSTHWPENDSSHRPCARTFSRPHGYFITC